ncbi:OB-fold-containig protein [Sphingomonas panni]|uniref:OB-fold-containig protein n=1 Tax=Sphingomonas panni TaxID=237612 RepID=UPI001F5B7266|nr:OB-fold-containig protein [Sphingomonas panni]
MMEHFIAPEAVVFTAAWVLMLLIGMIEAVGLGSSGLDLDLDLDSGLLDWLGVGRVPLLVLLVAFLAVFGGVGLAGQQVAQAMTGALLSPWIAIPAALVVALPLTSAVARLLARLLPRDETTAFEVDDLVGRTGIVTVGRAAAGSPARTRVLDPHGQPHHVLVEPNDSADSFVEGDTVLLVRREGSSFRAILHSSPRLTDWMEI